MNQKHMLIGLLLFVFIGFMGIIALDLKNKKQSVPDNDTNDSILSDNWGTPVSPEKPDPIVDKVQITASNYREAIKKSGEEGIPALVFFEADWCSWCKKMKKEFMADRDDKEIMKNYVLFFAVDDVVFRSLLQYRIPPSIQNCNICLNPPKTQFASENLSCI